VSGFLQLLTALGAEPSISITWTIPVAAAPATNPLSSAGAGAGPATSTQVASITGLALVPSRFRRGSHAASISSTKVPTGTTISFTLTQSATVTLAFEQSLRGVRAGRRCVPPSRSRGHVKPCTRWSRVSHTVVRQGHTGSDRIHFDGVLDGGFRLSPGRYRLSLSAADAAGSASAAERPSFTLLP
jgi:hypothetical protein